MKRVVLAAMTAAVLVPCSGSAQNFVDLDRQAWGPRIRVTPFAGLVAAASRTERWTVTNGGDIASADFDVDLAAGPAAGLTVDMQVFERFAVAVSGVLVSRGRTVEHATGDGDLFEHEGSSFLFTRAAIVMRLREEVSELQVHSLTGTLFAGPAWIREMPKKDPFADPVALESLDHKGFGFGFDAEIPLPWDQLSFTAGAEDYLIWWNMAEFGRRNDLLWAAEGIQTRSFVESGPSHNLLFHAGVSLRFR